MSNEESVQAVELENVSEVKDISAVEKEISEMIISEKPEFTFESEDKKLHLIIKPEDEEYLDNKYDDLIEYMKNNHTMDLSEEDKNVLYMELQDQWSEVSGKDGGKLNEISFGLALHRSEYKYLTDLILSKLEYNVDTVFYAMELDNMMNKMLEDNKFISDRDAIIFDMTAVDVHYLYHILSKHTVKGLTKSTRLFATILQRIAVSSKAFNYYKEKYDRLSKAIMLWTSSLDKGFSIDLHDPIAIMIWGEEGVQKMIKARETELKKAVKEKKKKSEKIEEKKSDNT